MYPAGITFLSFEEHTEVNNQSNGELYTSLFIKLTSICGVVNQYNENLEIITKFRATWVLFVGIYCWNS